MAVLAVARAPVPSLALAASGIVDDVPRTLDRLERDGTISIATGGLVSLTTEGRRRAPSLSPIEESRAHGRLGRLLLGTRPAHTHEVIFHRLAGLLTDPDADAVADGVAAARRCLDDDDVEAAVVVGRTVLAALDAGAGPAVLRVEALSDLASALAWAGRGDEAQHVLADAVTNATRSGDPVELACAALDEFVVMASGGSQGLRGLFVWDSPAFVQFAVQAARNVFLRLAALGVTADAPLRSAMTVAGKPCHASALIGALATTGTPLTLTSVPVTQPLDAIVANLNALQPQLLLSYPALAQRLAAEQRSGRLAIAPFAVVTVSDTLTGGARTEIESTFGVPVADSFGASEGLIGSAPPGDPVFTFAEDGCIIELVDERNCPVPLGTPSAKVLVTNLVNRVQPLIRIELDDSFVAVSGDGPDGHLRARVIGRSDRPLRFGACEVQPFVIRSVLVGEPSIVEYQVRQQSSGIEVAAVTSGSIDVEATERSLVAALEGAGLRKATAHVEIVTSLERDGVTGKVRRFVRCDVARCCGRIGRSLLATRPARGCLPEAADEGAHRIVIWVTPPDAEGMASRVGVHAVALFRCGIALLQQLRAELHHQCV
jgi:phenylacetate-CoA ligase